MKLQPSLEWMTFAELLPYPEAMDLMAQKVQDIQQGKAGEAIWLLEHPPLLTQGTSGQLIDVHGDNSLPVYSSGRGGQITYHGPGQRVIYVMLDLNKRERDLRKYVTMLESWVIQALECFGVNAERREGRVGLWVAGDSGIDYKIAAIGVRVQKWVTSHGIAVNVDPDLRHYEHFVPCGIRDHGVTSLKALGYNVTMAQLDQALRETFTDALAAQ